MYKKDYIAAPWYALFSGQGLADFEVLWNLPLAAIDEPNYRRGGWSRVFILPLRTADGGNRKMIVKRQVNYLSHTPAHPVNGVPTLRREFANIQHCRRWGIPTVQAVYYAERRDNRGDRAILITKYLEGYVPLDHLLRQWEQKGRPAGDALRAGVIEAVACLVRKLHRHRLRHGHLQPKHIMVKPAPDQVEARLIDLECMYRTLTAGQCSVADLSTLNRRLRHCSNPDRMRFLHAYMGLDRLDRSAKKLCRRILSRTQKKTARPGIRTAGRLSDRNITYQESAKLLSGS